MDEYQMFGPSDRQRTIWRKLADWWLGRIGESREVVRLNNGERFRDAVSKAMLTGPATTEQDVAECEFACNRDQEVVAVPKLVASVVAGLRMKLGLSAMDPSIPGNREMVHKETVKLLRKYNLRDKDAAAHLRLIDIAYWKEDSDRLVVDARARACRKSRFVQWLLREETVGYDW